MHEFRSATDEHAAHLTLLFDAFSGESYDAAPADALGMTPVHGLVQDVSVTFVEDEETVTSQAAKARPAHPIMGAEELSDLLSALPATISQAAAAVTTGQVGTGFVPASRSRSMPVTELCSTRRTAPATG